MSIPPNQKSKEGLSRGGHQRQMSNDRVSLRQIRIRRTVTNWKAIFLMNTVQADALG